MPHAVIPGIALMRCYTFIPDSLSVFSALAVQDMMSPAPSDLSVFSYNSRSVSPVPSPTVSGSRGRFPAYDTLTRRREVRR